MHVIDDQPATGSPKHSVFAKITTKKINATQQNAISKNDASASGTVENPIIPSML